jgi:hypothetical protein
MINSLILFLFLFTFSSIALANCPDKLCITYIGGCQSACIADISMCQKCMGVMWSQCCHCFNQMCGTNNPYISLNLNIKTLKNVTIKLINDDWNYFIPKIITSDHSSLQRYPIICYVDFDDIYSCDLYL